MAHQVSKVLLAIFLLFTLRELPQELNAQTRQSNVTGMQVLGQAVAAEFGKWEMATKSSVAAAGSATVELETSNVTVPDGTTINPFDTHTPILINDVAGSETVTPSAVACSSGAATCTFTGSFSARHLRFTVKSGTHGLQEAIDFQHARGGTVLVTSDWQGTTTMITNAVGYTNVSVRDTRSGNDYFYTWNGSNYAIIWGVTATGSITPTTISTVSVLNNVRYCNGFSGATADAKIAACVADLPSTGGTADVRGIEGAQSIASTITITKAKTKIIFGAATYTSTALMIAVAASNVEIECTRGTTFNETGSNDAIDIGDNITQWNDNIIRGCTFASNSGGGSSINVRKSSNTIVDANSIQNQSTGSIALNISGCNDCRVTNNTIGSVVYQGLVLISSSNGSVVSGNRIDCLSIASGVGMIVSSQALTIDGSNVIETCLLGMQIQAAANVSAYFENNVRSIYVSNGNPSNVNIVGARFFAPAVAAADAIYISVATNFTIRDNYFASGGSGYSNDAPITIGTDAFGGVIGPNNTFSTTKEVTFPADIGLASIDLVSEHTHFVPKNLAGNSFNVWPGGGTDSPPGTWILSGVNHARQSDSPSGKYSEDLIGQVGISLIPLATISATENASARGRYVSFSFWAKNISGSATTQLRLQTNDGITTTNIDRTVTASWVQYTSVVKVGATATSLSVTARNLNAGSTLRIAGPSVYIGSTLAVGELAGQQNSGLITLDVTDHALTGTTSITALTSVSMDAGIMGTGGAIHGRVSGTITGTAGAKTIEIRPNSTGGTVMATVSCDTSSTSDWSIDFWIYNVSAGSQRVSDVTYWKNTVNEADDKAAGFATTSAAWTLGVYGTLGNAGDTITVKTVMIEAKNGMN